MATKLGRIVSFFEGIQAIELHESLITWSCEIMGKSKFFISPSHTVPMTIKPGSALSYLKALLLKEPDSS